jgi:hypothetical protein
MPLVSTSTDSGINSVLLVAGRSDCRYYEKDSDMVVRMFDRRWFERAGKETPGH